METETPIFIASTIYSEFQNFQKIVCEGNLLEIKCPKNQIITIKDAWYGRNDTSNCPDCANCNTNCYRNITKKLEDIFNGKNTNSTTINNNLAGDPCGGTYKYSKITYTCTNSFNAPSQLKHATTKISQITTKFSTGTDLSTTQLLKTRESSSNISFNTTQILSIQIKNRTSYLSTKFVTNRNESSKEKTRTKDITYSNKLVSTMPSVSSTDQNSKSIPELSTAKIDTFLNTTVSIEILINTSDLTSSRTHETGTFSYVSKINASYSTAVDKDTNTITTTEIRLNISKFISTSAKDFNSEVSLTKFVSDLTESSLEISQPKDIIYPNRIVSTMPSVSSTDQNSKSIPELSTAKIDTFLNTTVTIEILINTSDLTSSRTHETGTFSYVSKINASYSTAVDTDTNTITTTEIRFNISKFVSTSADNLNSENNKGETQILPNEHFSEGSVLLFSDLHSFFSSSAYITKRAPLISEFILPTIKSYYAGVITDKTKNLQTEFLMKTVSYLSTNSNTTLPINNFTEFVSVSSDDTRATFSIVKTFETTHKTYISPKTKDSTTTFSSETFLTKTSDYFIQNMAIITAKFFEEPVSATNRDKQTTISISKYFSTTYRAYSDLTVTDNTFSDTTITDHLSSELFSTSNSHIKSKILSTITKTFPTELASTQIHETKTSFLIEKLVSATNKTLSTRIITGKTTNFPSAIALISPSNILFEMVSPKTEKIATLISGINYGF